jgi:hypothetical protein
MHSFPAEESPQPILQGQEVGPVFATISEDGSGAPFGSIDDRAEEAVDVIAGSLRFQYPCQSFLLW